MNFQILKLIIWPKLENMLPQVVEFKPGKVNVITGASRTGKSAIIPIIDYCLASKDCSIPIDTIRDHASWYGVVIERSLEQILIARKVPDGTKSSNDFYLMRGKEVIVPVSIEEANENLSGIKQMLDGVSGLPFFSLNGEEGKNGYEARLSFRDLMAFAFQSQDIVANQNILFYKTHAHEHREKLRNWFPFIIGAENTEILEARIRIQEIERILNRLRREVDRMGTVSAGWVANMQGHLRIAKEYGLLPEDYIESAEPSVLLAAASEILADIPDHTRSDTQDISQSNQQLRDMELKERELSLEIASIKKRLQDLKGLQGGLSDYGNAVKKRKDRLHISQWLTQVNADAGKCPSCGSEEHPSANEELTKIAKVFADLESEAKRVAEVPGSFSREESKLKAELDLVLGEKKILQDSFDLLRVNDQDAQREFQRRKNMYLFLGQLKTNLEYFQKLGDDGEFKREIASYQEEYNRLSKITDYQGVQKRIVAATELISAKMLTYLKTLDVEDKYKEVAPRFDIKDLNIRVMGSGGDLYYLSEVGSASNWVSFHIALMCALQEFFNGLTNSPVPSFVIFDQPSQVYFPKLKKDEIAKEDLSISFDENEDVDAVKKIFNTIAASIKKSKGQWQAIILDHADDSIYGNEDVHEVAVWRNGVKLIPLEWMV